VRAPAFWYRPPGLLARLLAPAGAVWSLGTRARQDRTVPLRAGVPVICVGNLVAGGAGKTPVVQDLLSRLSRAGYRPAALSRGHGGRLKGPEQVLPEVHGADEVGDEPLLLARDAVAWIARDRAMGAMAAAAVGADVVVMDDGFQNPRLHKDLSILVVDGAVGFGNGRVIPAGPLREPVADGLARADAVALFGEDRAGVEALLAGRLPLLKAQLVPDARIAERLRGRRVHAFAGIGRPEKFFATLEEIGAELVEAISFPDHHAYREEEAARLLSRAAAARAVPVTTAKDAVRLPARIAAEMTVLPVTVAWQDPAALDRLLAPLFPP